MTRRPRRAAAAALGALGLLAGVVALLARQGTLLVHQCVPDGAAGALGLRLALLRQDAVCPSGTLAIGGESRQVLAVVVLVALPVLVAHLVGMAAGVGLARHLRAVVRSALAVLGRRVRPGAARGLPVLRPVRLLAAPRAVRAPGPVDVGTPLRRGPPLRFA